MFSGLIPGLNSVHSPADDLVGQSPASLQALFKLSQQILLSLKPYSTSTDLFSPYATSVFRRPSFYSGESSELRTVVVWLIAATVLVLARLIHTNMKRTYLPLITEATTGVSSESDGYALFGGIQGDIDLYSDGKYAEDLQVQEALFASLLASQIPKESSPSSTRVSTNSNSKEVKITDELGESSQSFCGICLENKEIWQMYRNEKCSHSFCYDCTSNHIVAKVQDNVKIVKCPGVSCEAILESEACRWIIPNDVLIRWDESMCRSLIDESQIIYCPYKDCSAMLVNDDSGEDVMLEIKCPMCRRSMCGFCRVPWHSEFTCEEFRKLSGKKNGGEDLMVEELAKKKNWRKCPHCNCYVEKTEGCVHITCRCGHEFCYRCGSKWSGSHGACCQRS